LEAPGKKRPGAPSRFIAQGLRSGASPKNAGFLSSLSETDNPPALDGNAGGFEPIFWSQLRVGFAQVQYLVSLNVLNTSGCGNPCNFNPNNTITRGQSAPYLVRGILSDLSY
jgi:hypothetical protein